MTTAMAINIQYTLRPSEGSRSIVIELPRRLDVHAVPALREQLRRLPLDRSRRVALDASQVRHADAAGLAFLTEARDRCKADSRAISLTEVSLALRIAMELTGLEGAPLEDTDRARAGDDFEMAA